MSNKILIGIGIAAIIILLISMNVFGNQPQFVPNINNQPVPTVIAEIIPDNQNTLTINIKGSKFSFDPKEIKVKLGTKVKINFESVDGLHDWKLDEFNTGTAQINAGETASIEFIADKPGTFEYYCSVGNHRTMGMVGNLIIE